MFDALTVRWTIVPLSSPEPWLSCSGCGRDRAFRSSDKIRLNANGQKLDAWLIYKCVTCDKTWNRPIFERRNARSIDPGEIRAMQANDPDWVRGHAFDLVALRRHTQRIESSAAFRVGRETVREAAGWTKLDIRLAVPVPTDLRLDRLLATELPLSRSRLGRMIETGVLRVLSAEADPLRRRIKEGTRLVLDLAGEQDRDSLWRRAATEPAG